MTARALGVSAPEAHFHSRVPAVRQIRVLAAVLAPSGVILAAQYRKKKGHNHATVPFRCFVICTELPSSSSNSSNHEGEDTSCMPCLPCSSCNISDSLDDARVVTLTSQGLPPLISLSVRCAFQRTQSSAGAGASRGATHLTVKSWRIRGTRDQNSRCNVPANSGLQCPKAKTRRLSSMCKSLKLWQIHFLENEFQFQEIESYAPLGNRSRENFFELDRLLSTCQIILASSPSRNF